MPEELNVQNLNVATELRRDIENHRAILCATLFLCGSRWAKNQDNEFAHCR